MSWTPLDKSITHKVQCALCDDTGVISNAFGSDTCPHVEERRYQGEIDAALAASKQPDKHCQMCGGRGGWYSHKKWCKCLCTKPTAQQRKQQRMVQALEAATLGTPQTLF